MQIVFILYSIYIVIWNRENVNSLSIYTDHAICANKINTESRDDIAHVRMALP